MGIRFKLYVNGNGPELNSGGRRALRGVRRADWRLRVSGTEAWYLSQVSLESARWTESWRTGAWHAWVDARSA